ncbi:hemin ABC transporter substrate-binding protein [Alteromonas sediminis]|uniref:Hemin ABC transporter substrate-binding protein n=1 Tax=Alteromonas sediminis TaxID=2259342 RepID=A0A3N5Y0L7_9ALTE|nr:ABC transporter substrate-binding protein [Alteromonas sediminis]RPJ67012.1 hemin ABC transporter substrate-binding protein [Alteromonas sediminis]
MKMFQLLFFTAALCVFSCGVSAERRIVSAGGSVTETLYALGVGDDIVAVDTSSSYPLPVHSLPKVGYYRQLSPEGVLSMRPTMLVGHNNAGPQATLDALRRAGLELTLVQAPQNIQGVLTAIRVLAERFGKEDEGKTLTVSIREQLKQVAKEGVDRLKVGLILTSGQRGLTAAGKNTMPDDIIGHAGGLNAFSTHDGYKAISPESLLLAQPNILLVPSHVAREGVEVLCDSELLTLWVKQNGCNLHVVDSIMFMGMSPRVGESVQALHHTLSTFSQEH